MPLYRLCIGVDFGVSTSGVSYYLLGPAEDPDKPPNSIQLHDAREALQSSILGINDDDDDDDDDLSNWGTGVDDETPAVSLFKLSLIHVLGLPRNTELPDSIGFVRHIIDEMADMGKSGVDVVAKYLACLWADAKRVLDEQVRNRQIAAGDIDFCFMFGKPAVWLDETTNRMKRAIEESGMTFVGKELAPWEFFDEPEAAALAVVPQLVKSLSLKKDRTIVVADLGGGTVDFISYYLTAVRPTVKVRVCVAGEGRLLGDMFMRRALYSFVRREAEHAPDSVVQVDDGDKIEAEAKKLWETTQRMTAAELIDMPHPLKVLLSDGTRLSVELDGNDIVLELRKITNGIIELAKKQVSAVEDKTGVKPVMILVVGGFGCNKFLQSEMRSRLTHLGPHIEFTGQEGQFAVKNGAAIACVSKFGGGVGKPRTAAMSIDHNRPSRHSYGFWDGTSREDKVRWFLSKGGEMPVIVPLPPKAFDCTKEGHRAAALYYVSTPLKPGSLTVLKELKVVIKQHHIISKKEEILDGGARIELAVDMDGKNVRIKMSVNGEEDNDVHFDVRNY